MNVPFVLFDFRCHLAVRPSYLFRSESTSTGGWVFRPRSGASTATAGSTNVAAGTTRNPSARLLNKSPGFHLGTRRAAGTSPSAKGDLDDGDRFWGPLHATKCAVFTRLRC